MCGAAVPRTFFSRFTAGRGQAFARGVHAKSILSSERQQVAIGLSVQAIKREGGPIEEVRAGDVVWFCARRKALARRVSYDGDEPHRRSGKAERLARGLDGARDRPAIPKVRLRRSSFRLSSMGMASYERLVAVARSDLPRSGYRFRVERRCRVLADFVAKVG
jgi:hypothetical protein